MFPEIRAAWKDFRSGLGSDLLTLDIEAKEFSPTFTANTDYYGRNGFARIRSLLGGGPAWSGESVSLDSALNLSVVWACTRLISESIAFCPLVLLRDATGGKQAAKDHPLYRVLHDEPNEQMSGMSFRETLQAHVLNRGNAFSRIARRSGTGEVIALYPIFPEAVQIVRDARGNVVYVVKEGNEQSKSYTVEPGKPMEIFHIPGLSDDGVNGYSVIQRARQSFGTSIAADRYAGKFFASGGRVPYVLKMPGNFKDDTKAEEFRDKWNQAYGGGDNFHKAPILEGGLEYQQIGLKPEDAQFMQTRNFHVTEICRWYLISPHLVGDLSRATFSNIEHLAMQFGKFTLGSWFNRWESAINRCLLTPEEKAGGYFAKHNVNAFLRGDFLTRMQGYSTSLQNGITSINEVRDLEDLNPIEGGDDHHIQLNMQPIPGNGVPQATQGPSTEDTSINEARNPWLVRVGGGHKQ